MTNAGKLVLALGAVGLMLGLDRFGLGGSVEMDRVEDLPIPIGFVLTAGERYTVEVDTEFHLMLKWSLKGPTGAEVEFGREVTPHVGRRRIVLHPKSSGSHTLDLQLGKRDFDVTPPSRKARLVLRRGDYRILSPVVDRLSP